MGILVAVGGTIIIPGIVAHFMTGAASGVIGNATGGRRGAVLGAMTNGLMITFLPLLVLPFLGNVGLQNSTFSDADFGVSGLLIGGAVQIGHAAVIGLIICSLAAVFIGSALTNRREAAKAAVTPAEKESQPAS